MSYKLVGSICVLAASGIFGVALAYHHLQSIKLMENLITILHDMECELRYRRTSLPQLCRQIGDQRSGKLSEVFLILSEEMDQQIKSDAYRCMLVALEKANVSDPHIYGALQELGNSFGRFDVDGQVRGLKRIREKCELDYKVLLEKKKNYLYSYQTLGLCAGAAIVILFV